MRQSSGYAAFLFMVCLALAGMGPAVPRAQAAGYGKNKVQTRDLQWQVLNTPHLRIHYYDGAEELAVRAALIGERAYQEYADWFGRDLPWRVPFILYTSHNDFAQTNISDHLIGEGTGGFSEPLRNRVVLPYRGSHAEFVHVIRHELIHSFMFHMAFGRGDLIRPPSRFPIPLWFAEGMAEWFSSGWDEKADMVLRDATINDYLVPLDHVHGYMAYKEGQAAIRLLAEKYGSAKLVEFWWRVGQLHGVEAALEAVYGLRIEDLNEIFLQEMRRRYWPDYAELELVEDIARPLTDHVEERTHLNEMPALNPAGDQLVYFSDREGLVDVWLMSAIDGGVIRRLGRSRRSSRFESFHSFVTGPTFAPDGREIALVAKSGNHETLHTIDVANGEITRSVKLGLDSAIAPAWSPAGDAIVLVGTRFGRTDLYLLDLTGEAASRCGLRSSDTEILAEGMLLHRLTDDVGDETSPAWSPDGTRVVYVQNPLAEINYAFSVDSTGLRRLEWARPEGPGSRDPARESATGSIRVLDLATGSSIELADRQAGLREPLWLDAGRLVAVSGASGIDNLILITLNAVGDRVAGQRTLTNVLGGISHLTYSPQADRLAFSAFHAGGYDIYAVDDFLAEWSSRLPPGGAVEPVVVVPPSPPTRSPTPRSLAAPEQIGVVEPYRPKLSPDLSQALGGGAVYFNSAVGLGMVNVITLSDLLGDHRVSLLVNFYGSFENSDLAVGYTYLKRRLDYGGGIFHYNNYYNSVFSSVGELLPKRTLFHERNYGLFGYASYPLDTFRRFDLELQFLTNERTDFSLDEQGYYLVEEARTQRRLWQPTLSYTHDTALFGPHGPLLGTRWTVGFTRTLALSRTSIDRHTAILDYRKYWMPWRRNSFALHLSLASSGGADPRGFVLGGPWTLRGYTFYDFETIDNLAGRNLALLSLEYRLPLLDYLIFGWPARWGLTGIGAATYVDLGSAWDDKVMLVGKDASGHWGLQEMHADVGVGLRANILFLPLKFDWAWKTDLRRFEDLTFQFSIGPEF